eukprot:Polyplicarium_translucidae@DN1925_c0_g1_i1.p2
MNTEDAEMPEDADEALSVGENFLAESEFEAAVAMLSHALKLKLDSVGGDELDHSLRRFYLSYGDSLLQQEENLGDYLRLDKDKQGAEEPRPEGDAAPEGPAEGRAATSSQAPPGSGEGEEEEEEEGTGVSDEQLAWENLELARVTYARYLEAQKSAGKADGDVELRMDVEDASFVHVRLGDMLTVSERFDDAAKEFQAALDLREAHKFPYTAMPAPLISLGQAKLFGLHPDEALRSFEKALSLIKNHVSGVDGAVVPPEKLASYVLTAEDLRLQIDEVRTNIEKGVYEKMAQEAAPMAEGGGASASSDAAPQGAKLNVLKTFDAEPARTTGSFDAPRLESVDVIDLGVFSSSRKRKLQEEEVPPADGKSPKVEKKEEKEEG